MVQVRPKSFNGICDKLNGSYDTDANGNKCLAKSYKNVIPLCLDVKCMAVTQAACSLTRSASIAAPSKLILLSML